MRRTLALALVLAATGCTEEPDPRIAQGEALYGEYCALCHGDAGQGYAADAANALNNQTFLATVDRPFLERAIARGRPGTPMSAWGTALGGPLDDADVDALVVLMKSWQTVADIDVASVDPGEGSAVRGEAPYAVECAECHGDEGEGGTYMSINNPEFLASVSDGFLHHVIAEGRPATPMKGYAGSLTEQQVDDLVALIRSWQVPVNEGPIDLPSKDLGDPILNPDGPDPGFTGDALYVPVAEVHTAYEAGSKMVILDARTPSDYVAGHIAGAVSVPFYDATDFADQLPKDTWIVCYCACPHAESTAAAEALISVGFDKVKVLDEGLPLWEDNGHPMNTGPNP